MTDPTRIALVTGASRGLGLVIARVLASRGYSLVIGGRDPDTLAAAAVALSRHGPVVPVAGDITDAAVRGKLIDEARRLGGLSVLVNNASELGRIEPLLAFDVPTFGRLFPVNVGAPMVLTQLAVPLLARQQGLIVNITSDAATAAYPGWGPYGATKAALELLTRTLASELRDQGVSAILVDPGDMRTRMHQDAFPGEDISDRPLPEVTEPFWQLAAGSEAGGHQRRTIRRPAGGCPLAPAGLIDAGTLPPYLEASEPPEARGLARDGVRLLISRVDTDSIQHSRFSDLSRWLAPGDLLVVNTSATLNAALTARSGSGGTFAVHLSTRLPGNFWVVEVRRPGPLASLPYRHARRRQHLRAGRGRPRHPACPISARRCGGSGSRLWLAALQLAGPVLRYLERFGRPIRYSYVNALVAVLDVPDRVRDRARQRGDALGGTSVHPRARDAAHLGRDSDRAATAPHRRRQPRGPRTPVRGVLSASRPKPPTV